MRRRHLHETQICCQVGSPRNLGDVGCVRALTGLIYYYDSALTRSNIAFTSIAATTIITAIAVTTATTIITAIKIFIAIAATTIITAIAATTAISFGFNVGSLLPLLPPLPQQSSLPYAIVVYIILLLIHCHDILVENGSYAWIVRSCRSILCAVVVKISKMYFLYDFGYLDNHSAYKEIIL